MREDLLAETARRRLSGSYDCGPGHVPSFSVGLGGKKVQDLIGHHGNVSMTTKKGLRNAMLVRKNAAGQGINEWYSYCLFTAYDLVRLGPKWLTVSGDVPENVPCRPGWRPGL